MSNVLQDRKKKRDEEYEQYWLSPTVRETHNLTQSVNDTILTPIMHFSLSSQNKDLYEWERPVLNIRRLEAVKSRPSQMAQALPPPPPYSTYVWCPCMQNSSISTPVIVCPCFSIVFGGSYFCTCLFLYLRSIIKCVIPVLVADFSAAASHPLTRWMLQYLQGKLEK